MDNLFVKVRAMWNFWWKKLMGIVLIFSILICGYYFYDKNEQHSISPRIVDISRYGAKIIWDTPNERAQEVFYKIDSSSLEDLQLTQELGKEFSIKEDKKTKEHTINITGLLPDTFYKYYIPKANSADFRFKTSPQKETGYRVMLYNKDFVFQQQNTQNFSKEVKLQLPDFAIINGNLSSKDYIAEEKQFFENNRVAQNMLLLLSPSQKDLFTKDAEEYYQRVIPADNNKIDYVFEYGNSTFIIMGPMKTNIYPNDGFKERVKWLDEKLSNTESINKFIVLNSTGEKSDLMGYIYSPKNLEKVTSVLVSGKIAQNIVADKPKILDFTDKYLTLEIDGQSVVGYVGTAEKKEPEYITIREVGQDFKKSCVYCRKLLDSKKYNESIAWYRNFIIENKDKFDLDLSLFEIAKIYDQYLNEYDKAIIEYKKLIEKYPSSNKLRQAKQRLEYLQEYSDYNFLPLKIFEIAKFKTFQTDQNKAIEEIDSILAKYPNAKIEPDVLFWLGYTTFQAEIEEPDLIKKLRFSMDSKKIDMSLNYFNKIIEKYDNKKLLENAWTAIGNTNYQAGRFDQSIIAYNNAIKYSDSLNFALKDKIEKSNRNIIRDNIFILLVPIIILSFISVLFIKPIGFSIISVKNWLYTAVIYLLVSGIGWLIFCMDYPDVLKLMVYIAIFIPIAKLVAYELVRKLLDQKNNIIKVPVAMLLTLFLSMCILYVIVYLKHFLVVYGM
jgi:tetratricopeptide (TPR) repeat protein